MVRCADMLLIPVTTVLYLGGGALFSEHSGRLLCGFNVAIKGLKTLSGGPRVCCLLPNGTI